MAELTLHCASTLAVCAADPLGTQTSVATAADVRDMILQRQAEAELDEDGS
jgi:hypothetical protein